MKTLLILILSSTIAKAVVIPLDLGPAADHFAVEELGYVHDLDGTLVPPDGHVVFDLKFAHNQFLRFTERSLSSGPFNNPSYFDLVAVITTPTVYLGSLVDVPLHSLDIEYNHPFLVYGFHFDIDLNNYGGGGIPIDSLRFFTSSNAFWAVGPHVPETGSTVVMLTFALFALLSVASAWIRKGKP